MIFFTRLKGIFCTITSPKPVSATSATIADSEVTYGHSGKIKKAGHIREENRLLVGIPIYGALDGGSPMSPVDFKKWQCPLSLF